MGRCLRGQLRFGRALADVVRNGRVVDRLGGIVAIAEPGRDYEFRLTLTNDAQGRGAEVYKLLFCTDPSVWA